MEIFVMLPRIVTKRPAAIFLHLAISAIALLYLAPFLWMLCAAFKTPGDIFQHSFLPWGHLHDLTLRNFAVLFSRVPFGVWLANSIFFSSTQTFLVVTLSSLAGFALAKYEFAGKRPLMAAMLATMLLPGVVLLPGYLDLMSRLGWFNSAKAIILPGSISVFGAFLFRQSMRAVPDELIHAARVDGCIELRIWWEVALPLTRPMTAAFTLLSFLSAWNSYLWPSTVLQDQRMFTVPMGLANMIGLPEFESQYGVLMAGALIGMLPVIVLFFALQKDFIAGLSSGALKG